MSSLVLIHKKTASSRRVKLDGKCGLTTKRSTIWFLKLDKEGLKMYMIVDKKLPAIIFCCSSRLLRENEMKRKDGQILRSCPRPGKFVEYESDVILIVVDALRSFPKSLKKLGALEIKRIIDKTRQIKSI